MHKILRNLSLNRILLLSLAAFMLYNGVTYSQDIEKKIQEEEKQIGQVKVVENKEEKDGLISKVSKALSPSEAEASIIPLPQISAAFMTYINMPVASHYNYKNISRNEWEQMPVLGPAWKGYFWVKDAEKTVKDKYLTVNFDKDSSDKKGSKKTGIRKVGGDIDKDGMKVNFDFHEYKKKKKAIWVEIEEPWQGKIDAKVGFSIRF